MVFIGLAAAQGATALALVVVARRVAAVGYGQYLASYGLASLLVVLAGLGLDQWLLAKALPASDRVVNLWRCAIHQRLRLLFLWLPAVAVFSFLLPKDQFPPSLLILSAIGLAADSLSSLSYVALRRLDSHRSVTVFQILGALMLLGGTLVLPLSGDSLLEFALFRTFISLGLAVGSLWWMLAASGHLRSEVNTEAPLHEARPFFVAEIAVAVYMRADLTIVAMMLGAESAGVYGPALNLVNMCFLLPYALYLLVVPILARRFSGSRRLYLHLGTRQATAQGAIGALMAVVLFVLATPVIDLIFGPEYAASARIIRLLSPLLVFKSLSFGFGALLSTAGQQARRTSIQIGIAAFSVVMNLAVIQRWGIDGVASIYVLSEMLLCLGYLLLVVQWRRSLAPRADIT